VKISERLRRVSNGWRKVTKLSDQCNRSFVPSPGLHRHRGHDLINIHGFVYCFGAGPKPPNCNRLQ
jgi:hypothetical protein